MVARIGRAAIVVFVGIDGASASDVGFKKWLETDIAAANIECDYLLMWLADAKSD